MFNTYLTGIRFTPAFFGEDTGVCIEWLLQPSQPLPRILHLSNTRVSVFPEVEEFRLVFDGFVSVHLKYVTIIILGLLSPSIP